jgi:hypothetical protein
MREALSRELSNSFCILGPPGPDLENSAVLANTLLTGALIKNGSERDALILAAAGACAILAGLCLLGPWVSLILGLVLSASLCAAFSCHFVLSASWTDPLIPAAAALSGVLFSFAFALLAKRRAAARFRLAYGPRMESGCLRRLIRAGRPFPSETVTVNAAIVAVRNGDLSGVENRSGPGESAAAVAAFREAALRLFGESGAVMTGVEGDLAMFALGSPLERQALKMTKKGRPYDDSDTEPDSPGAGVAAGPGAPLSPGARAAALALDILNNTPGTDSWRFAVDAGECCFSWSAASGYTASGPAAVTARVLSNLCSRYKTRFMVSGRVAGKLGDIPVKKLGALVDQTSGEREEFYGMEAAEIKKSESDEIPKPL